jgi:phosphoribosylformylglycinamidine (FGAM) synthase PurS component
MPATTKIRTDAIQINVYIREGLVDAVGDGLMPDIADLGISGVKAVRHIAVYSIQGKLSATAPQRIGAELLADPVTQDFSIGEPPQALTHGAWTAHVKYNLGVTDPVGETAVKGINDLGIAGATAVSTSKIYVLRGRVKKNEVEEICRRLLANSVIQTYYIEKK